MKSPNKQQLVAFKNLLEREGLEVKLRESRGGKIKAACGQLVSEHNKKGRGAVPSAIRLDIEKSRNNGTVHSNVPKNTREKAHLNKKKRKITKKDI